MSKTAKKLIALITLICSVISSVPVIAAEQTVYIENTEDLKELSKNCSLDSWSRGVNVVLKNNINVSGSGFTSIPIFGGNFDGGGYTISGLSIKANEPVQGFFRYVQEGARVENLTVKGTIHESEGKEKFGGIAGINRGSIINCSFYGEIGGDSDIGGIVGINEASGRIGNCINEGTITSQKHTGGIAGENFGSILKCVNRGSINTSSKETKVDLEDINLESLDTEATEEESAIKGNSDTGGIAGYSGGILQSCQNYGPIGYQHMGYNIGGIAGRQGGYISGCVNHGQILGRKDVGGIVGQAEPYIVLMYSSDSLQDLDTALNDMQGLVNNMLDDIDYTTDTVSGRINTISIYASDARESSKELIDKTSDYMDDIKDFANDNINEINDFSARVTDTFDRLVPVIEDLEDVSDLFSDVADDLYDALSGVDDITDIGEEAGKHLKDAAEHFKAAQKDIKDAIDKIKDAIEKVLDSAVGGNEEELAAAIGELKAAIEQLSAAYGGMNDALAQIKDAIGEIEGLPIEDEQKQKIIDGIEKLIVSVDGMKKSFGDIAVSLLKIVNNISWDSIKDSFGDISGIIDDVVSASDEVAKAIKDIVKALREADGLSNIIDDMADGIADALDGAGDMGDSVTSALKKVRKIVRNLADQDPIEFSTLDSDYHLDTQDLHASLNGISDELKGLNNDIKSSGDKITDDLRAINNQFNKITNIMIDALSPDEEEKTLKDITTDMSDTDIHSGTDGKIEGCTNMGKIEADINVGGIAGAMAIEYDLDPEDDIASVGTKSLNFRYETKAVALGCKNYGSVISKKNCVGGIAGKMDLGTVAECEGYGYVKSTSGDYVGGIAGYSDSSIRDSFAKCILSGGSFLGGIAGQGSTVENCHSIIDIEDCIGRIGAVAGDAEDKDKVRGNSFIDTGYAGIDSISYEGKAAPVTYDQMGQVSGLPESFLEFTVKFKADGSIIKTVPFTFGEDLSDIEFPEVPEKYGYYGSWPETDLSHMTFSTVLEAEYEPWVTVLTSDETGENTEQPLALAEGVFTENDKITAQYTQVDKLPSGASGGDNAKVISVSIESGTIDKTTKIRLLKGTEDSVKLWKLEGEKWHKESFEENGSYIITDMDGTEGVYCIAPAADTVKGYVAAAAIAVLAAAFILSKIKKKPIKPKK